MKTDADQAAFTKLLQVLQQLENEHRSLEQEWMIFNQVNMTSNNPDETYADGKEKLQSLRDQAVLFVKRLNCHLEAEEHLLLPAMKTYCKEEDTVPSIRFSSLLMQQYVRAAHISITRFIAHVDELRDPVSKKDTKR